MNVRAMFSQKATCCAYKNPRPSEHWDGGQSASYCTNFSAGFVAPDSEGRTFRRSRRRTRRLAGFLSRATGAAGANAPMKAALDATSTATTVQIGISRPIVAGASPVTQDRVSATASADAGRPAFRTALAAWMLLRISSTRSQKSFEPPCDRLEVRPAVSSQRGDFCAS
jgi:hypothetical protein